MCPHRPHQFTVTVERAEGAKNRRSPTPAGDDKSASEETEISGVRRARRRVTGARGAEAELAPGALSHPAGPQLAGSDTSTTANPFLERNASQKRCVLAAVQQICNLAFEACVPALPVYLSRITCRLIAAWSASMDDGYPLPAHQMELTASTFLYHLYAVPSNRHVNMSHSLSIPSFSRYTFASFYRYDLRALLPLSRTLLGRQASRKEGAT